MSSQPDSTATRDRMDIVVTPSTAQEVYPQASPPRRKSAHRTPITRAMLEGLPDEFVRPVLAMADRGYRVWCYLIEGDEIGVEVLNQPLRSHHRSL